MIEPAFRDLTDLRVPDDFLSLGRIPVVKAARGRATVIVNVDSVKTLFMGAATDVEREAEFPRPA